MKRRALKLAGLLLLGAALNVAVAWGFFQANLKPRDIRFREPTPAESHWWGSRLDRSRYSVGDVSESLGVGRYDISVKSTTLDGTKSGPRAVRFSKGWPLASLSYERWLDAGTGDAIAERGMWKGISLGKSDFVPTLPVWPGFAINTLFYAGVLWVLFAGPFALRRMIRRRRGRCPACAYPIGTSEVCTECGAAVTPTPIQS